jgi:hypothetical protein
MGRPAVLVATTPFVDLAAQLARAYGMPAPRIAEAAHPIGGLLPDAVVARAEEALERLLAVLGAAPR